MANLYRVTGEWLVKADSAEDAENLIENAVAAKVDEADLEDCNAELEDADVEETPNDEAYGIQIDSSIDGE